MAKLLIIVITYNGQNYIENCLADLDNLPFIKIIIIDNKSEDNTLQTVNKKNPNVKTISNDQNVGFGQANNIGLKYALEKDFDYILLLNQDTHITKNAILSMIDIMEENKDYGILSPLHYYKENELQKSFSNHIKANGNLIKDINNGIFTKKIYDIPFVNAAIWLMSKECVRKVGGFCPAFFHYGEDANYCHRTLYHGFEIGIVPSIKAYHYSLDNHSNYYKKKEVHRLIQSEILKILNPLNNYSYYKYLIVILIRLIINILLLRKKAQGLFNFFLQYLSIDLVTLKEMKEQSKYSPTPFIRNKM